MKLSKICTKFKKKYCPYVHTFMLYYAASIALHNMRSCHEICQTNSLYRMIRLVRSNLMYMSRSDRIINESITSNLALQIH